MIRLMFKIQVFPKKWLLKKFLTSEQMCFLCVFRILFICFHKSVWMYYLHLIHMCSQKQRERETKFSFSLGMSCGAAVQGQLCQRLIGQQDLYIHSPRHTQQSCSAALSPLQNTSLEICNRALNHLTCNGIKLSQLLLLLSMLATKDKCSLLFIAIFSYEDCHHVPCELLLSYTKHSYNLLPFFLWVFWDWLFCFCMCL